MSNVESGGSNPGRDQDALRAVAEEVVGTDLVREAVHLRDDYGLSML